MREFSEKFESLKRTSDEYFHTAFDSEEAETKENVRIKSELLSLMGSSGDGDLHVDAAMRKAVIDYLCDVCGHSGDLEVLKNHSPSILSVDELDYIIHNSALSRWF